MRVNELIKQSVWMPGQAYRYTKPELCITLPTFRRLTSGYFERCVDSLLAQKFTDFELIIVDDCSIDGTFERIQKYMRADERISCIRHERNIGLPAISEYEAFCKSSASYFGFAFDDCLFPLESFNSIMQVARQHQGKAITGYCKAYNIRKESSLYGKGITEANLHPLRLGNFLDNHGLLFHREVFETVGHYDPHVSLIRLCDWDLLRRVHMAGLLVPVDVYMGEQDGGILKDSLGKSFSINMQATLSRVSIERNAMLSTENYLACDVLSIPPGLNRESVSAFAGMVEKNFSNRYWYAPVMEDTYVPETRGQGVFTLAQSSPPAAFLALEGVTEEMPGLLLQEEKGFCVQFLDSTLASGYMIIAESFADSSSANTLTPFFSKISVPVYVYDVHADLLSLVLHADTKKANLVKDWLADSAGVLVPSQKLAALYKKRKIHDTVDVLPPTYLPNAFQTNRQEHKDFSIAVTLDRQDGEKDFLDYLYPALASLAAPSSLRLLCPVQMKKHMNILQQMPQQISWYDLTPESPEFSLRLKNFQPDIVIDLKRHHPLAALLPPTMFLLATAAGAVLVAPNSSCEAIPQGMSFPVEPTLESITKVITALFHEPQHAKRCLHKADPWCQEHYGTGHAVSLLQQLAVKHPAPCAYTFRRRVQDIVKVMF